MKPQMMTTHLHYGTRRKKKFQMQYLERNGNQTQDAKSEYHQTQAGTTYTWLEQTSDHLTPYCEIRIHMGFHSVGYSNPAATVRRGTTIIDTIEPSCQNNDKVYLNSDTKTLRKRFPKTFSSLQYFPRWILRYQTLPKWCAQLHKRKSLGNTRSKAKYSFCKTEKILEKYNLKFFQ